MWGLDFRHRKEPDFVITKLTDFEGYKVFDHEPPRPFLLGDGEIKIKTLVKNAILKAEKKAKRSRSKSVYTINGTIGVDQPMKMLRDEKLGLIVGVSPETSVLDRRKLEEEEEQKIIRALQNNRQVFAPLARNFNIAKEALHDAIKSVGHLTKHSEFIYSKLSKMQRVCGNDGVDVPVLNRFLKLYDKIGKDPSYGTEFQSIVLAIINSQKSKLAEGAIDELRHWQAVDLHQQVHEHEEKIVNVLQHNVHHYSTTLNLSKLREKKWEEIANSFWRGNVPCYMSMKIDKKFMGTSYESEENFYKLFLSAIYCFLHNKELIDDTVTQAERELLTHEQPCSVRDPLVLASMYTVKPIFNFFVSQTKFRDFFPTIAGDQDSMQLVLKQHSDPKKYVLIITRCIKIKVFNADAGQEEVVGILTLKARITARKRIGENQVGLKWNKEQHSLKERIESLAEEIRVLEEKKLLLEECTDTTKIQTRTFSGESLSDDQESLSDIVRYRKDSDEKPQRMGGSLIGPPISLQREKEHAKKGKSPRKRKTDYYDVVIHPTIKPLTSNEEILAKLTHCLEPKEEHEKVGSRHHHSKEKRSPRKPSHN